MFDVFLFSVISSGNQLGCRAAAISAQQPVEHVKNALQNIATEGTKHSVGPAGYAEANACAVLLDVENMVKMAS